MEQLKIIGTSHIAKQSIAQIKKAMLEFNPHIIAIELDAGRAHALMAEEKRSIPLREIAHIGLKGFLFVKIGQYVQQKLGRIVGIAPGADMKTAMDLAQQQKRELALIDQPITTTLKNFSAALTWKERWHFIEDLLNGLFFPRRQLKELGLEQFDLEKVPETELIEKMVRQLQKRYPSIYKTVVEDRNRYMVKKIIGLIRKNPQKKILVVVGAGHKKGIQELLLKVDIVN